MSSRASAFTRRFLLGTALAAGALTALPALAAAETIRVGVSAGPHAQILEAVRAEAKKAGLDIRIVEFTDYVVPNAALAAGEIEANSFQHQPYLDNQVKDRGFKIEGVAKTVVFPMGFYSKKLKSIDALPAGARVGIQNDPTNGGRALLLLAAHGVITLKDNVGLKPTILDVVANPKKIRLLELDAAQLPRALDDLDLAAVNTNYAIPAGLDPTRDALIRETPNSPYTNIIAVQSARKNEAWVAKLVTAYRSAPVKAFIEAKFKGAVAVSW